jgi:hypothetical protein
MELTVLYRFSTIKKVAFKMEIISLKFVYNGDFWSILELIGN